jgi:DNA repair protein RadC
MKTQLTNLAGEIVPVYKSGKPAAATMPKITSCKDAADYLRNIWQHNCIDIRISETFVCLYLNRQNRVLGFEVIGQGSATATVCDMQRIFRTALKLGAQGLILAHNHPSGADKPSHQDEALTKKAKNAGTFLDINVLDHIILMPEAGHYSFADNGLL